MAKLQVIDLSVKVEDKLILKHVNLEANTNEINVIMGPNGTGKSTLAGTIMGYYKYEVVSGSILLDGEDILKMSVDERARKGLFLAMQSPAEITGVTNSEFIKQAMEARMENDKHISLFKFIKELSNASKDLKMKEDLPQRYLNVGFSGGEKKRNEVLQMKLLKPKIAILDEIDSGLDIDALRIVGENVYGMKSDDFGALVITHYERLLDYIIPDKVHIMMNGTVVRSGGKELIEKIDQEGYDWLKLELGLIDDEPVRTTTTLGTCAVNTKKWDK